MTKQVILKDMPIEQLSNLLQLVRLARMQRFLDAAPSMEESIRKAADTYEAGVYTGLTIVIELVQEFCELDTPQVTSALDMAKSIIEMADNIERRVIQEITQTRASVVH